METKANYQEELDETLQSLFEDILLLDALTLREHHGAAPLLRSLSADLLPQTRQRLMDYLSQHAGELYFLHQKAKK